MKIKIRAWDGVKMEVYQHDITEPYYNIGLSHFLAKHFNSDLMLFTGLKENYGFGLEIYEGDVVVRPHKDCNGDIYNDIYQVIYEAPEFKLKTIKSEIFRKGAIVNLFGQIKVIGNIHENPDLLNEKTD